MIAFEFRNFLSSCYCLKFVKITQLCQFFHLDLEQLAAVLHISEFTAKHYREGSTVLVKLASNFID